MTGFRGGLSKKNKKLLVGALVAIVVLMVGGANFLTYQVKEAAAETTKYQLKQLEMQDEKCGWAITTENKLVHTENGVDDFRVIKSFEHISELNDGFIHADFVGENIVYAAYFEDETQELVVEYTLDKGMSWM